MKFKVGDKVRIREDLEVDERYGDLLFVGGMEDDRGNVYRVLEAHSFGVYTLSNKFLYAEEMLEPIEDPLAKKIEERNNKLVKTISDENLLNEDDPIEPDHYKIGDRDLFDEWHERYYYSEKMFTGREVFIEIMKSVAERYARRYPNKNPEDIEKAIYCLQRLKEYEENEE